MHQYFNGACLNSSSFYRKFETRNKRSSRTPPNLKINVSSWIVFGYHQLIALWWPQEEPRPRLRLRHGDETTWAFNLREKLLVFEHDSRGTTRVYVD